MNMIQTSLIAIAISAPTLLVAQTASAQATSIAVIDPAGAIFNAKALSAASSSISTKFKADYERIGARQRTLASTVQPLLAKLDSNNDKRIDDTELAAAESARRPELQQIATARQTAEREITQMATPANLAEAYAIDQIRQKYRPALDKVAGARRVGLVLTTDTAAFVQPTADLTQAVTAEIDTSLPTANITPPANWQPSQETVQLLQQYQQLVQLAVQRQQAQQAAGAAARPAGAAPAPAAPATSTPRPQGR